VSYLQGAFHLAAGARVAFGQIPTIRYLELATMERVTNIKIG
jgi:hypothetical protein